MLTAIFYDQRHHRMIVLRGRLVDVLLTLRAWCPGGRVAEVLHSAGRVQ